MPAHARVYAALGTARMQECSGFDLGAFNAFRSNAQAWCDLEHLAATDMFGKQHGRLLSAPVLAFEFDFSSLHALPAASRAVELTIPASAAGVLNCVTYWFELDLGDGMQTIHLGAHGPPVGRWPVAISGSQTSRQVVAHSRWLLSAASASCGGLECGSQPATCGLTALSDVLLLGPTAADARTVPCVLASRALCAQAPISMRRAASRRARGGSSCTTLATSVSCSRARACASSSRTTRLPSR